MLKKRLVIATNNEGKLEEFRKIFSQYKVLGLNDFDIEYEVEEDANTYYDNALKKAREIFQIIKCPVIADDSGLGIDKLNGFPGVLTHRWLGKDATDQERNDELIRNVSEEPARFTCVLVYYDGSNIQSGHGELVGKIASSPRGDNGFGFDSIFELPDGRTLAQLSPEEKNRLSARRLAAEDLAKKLR